MSERLIHIARNGEKLGKVAPDEVAELVKSGLLRRDDDYWHSGMNDWRSLGSLPALNSGVESPEAWKRDAKSMMADAAGLLARGTAKLAEGARSLAFHGAEPTPAATRKLLTDFFPELKKLAQRMVESKPFLSAESALSNDDVMKRCFRSVFDVLPGPVARLVPEDAFVEFCLTKKQELLGRSPANEVSSIATPPPQLRLSHIRLLVTDFAAMFAFYQDILSLAPRFPSDGMYAEFDTGSAVLALFHRDFMAEALQIVAPHEAAETLQRPVLVFSVPDVDAVYVQLRDRGVDFVAGPTDRAPWHVRTMHLKDPEGNLVEINSSLHG